MRHQIDTMPITCLMLRPSPNNGTQPQKRAQTKGP